MRRRLRRLLWSGYPHALAICATCFGTRSICSSDLMCFWLRSPPLPSQQLSYPCGHYCCCIYITRSVASLVFITALYCRYLYCTCTYCTVRIDTTYTSISISVSMCAGPARCNWVRNERMWARDRRADVCASTCGHLTGARARRSFAGLLPNWFAYYSVLLESIIVHWRLN